MYVKSDSLTGQGNIAKSNHPQLARKNNQLMIKIIGYSN